MKRKQLLLEFLLTAGALLLAVYPEILYVLQVPHTGISYVLTSLIFALPIVVLLRMCPRPWQRQCMLLLLLSGSLTETAMVILYKGFLLAGNVLAIAGTNTHEAWGLIRTSVHVVWYWLPCLALYGLLCAGEVRVGDCFRRFRLWLFIVSLAVAAAFTGYKHQVFYHGKLTLRYYVENRILNRPPYNAGLQAYRAIQLTRIKQYIKASDSFTLHAAKRDTLSVGEVYVLLIGESLCYDNLSLNGRYPRTTTPRMERMEHIVLYDDYYSAACLTMWSVPQIMTRATPSTFETCYREKAIWHPFHEAGFSTYAISVAGQQLLNDRYLTDGVDEFFRVPADSCMPPLIDSLARSNSKTFIVLEMAGSHSFYSNYTAPFDVFHPNINSEPEVKSDSIYLNAYDNTVLYTDYLLTDIATRIEEQEAVAAWLFVSDHGETQPGAHAGGHGGDCSPSKREYHVPLIVWYSSEYASVYPTRVDNLRRHKAEPVNSDNVFYSVCDMANLRVDVPPEYAAYSIFGDSLCRHERTVLVPDGKTVLTVE
ncbi:MAG: phosphoethanolamine transferase [Paludibacteraceae bacterium]|nr:phosphoethanolamine transferase [Paludibacteraceae bacterium]